MESPIRQLADRRGVLAAVVLLLIGGTIIAALLARGSDHETGASDTVVQSRPTHVLVAPAAPGAPSRSSDPSRPAAASAKSGGSAEQQAVPGNGSQPAKSVANGDPRSSQSAVPAHHPDGTCPPSLSRSECLANVRVSSRHTKSYPVSKPSECVHALSRKQCQAVFEAEEEAPGGSGASYPAKDYSPEDCLRVYTSEQCEALEEEFEAQYAASQQAGN